MFRPKHSELAINRQLHDPVYYKNELDVQIGKQLTRKVLEDQEKLLASKSNSSFSKQKLSVTQLQDDPKCFTNELRTRVNKKNVNRLSKQQKHIQPTTFLESEANFNFDTSLTYSKKLKPNNSSNRQDDFTVSINSSADVTKNILAKTSRSKRKRVKRQLNCHKYSSSSDSTSEDSVLRLSRLKSRRKVHRTCTDFKNMSVINHKPRNILLPPEYFVNKNGFSSSEETDVELNSQTIQNNLKISKNKKSTNNANSLLGINTAIETLPRSKISKNNKTNALLLEGKNNCFDQFNVEQCSLPIEPSVCIGSNVSLRSHLLPIESSFDCHTVDCATFSNVIEKHCNTSPLINSENDYETVSSNELCLNSTVLKNVVLDKSQSGGLESLNKFEENSSFDDGLIDIPENDCVNSEIFGNFEVIDVDSERIALILEPNCRVYVSGLTEARVLKGAVEILGYCLQPFITVELFSPRGSALIYIESIKLSDKIEGIKEIHKKLPAEKTLPDNIIQKINELLPGSAAMLCKKLELSKISFMEAHIAQQIFPKLDKPVNCHFQNTIQDWNVFVKSEEWNSIADNFEQSPKLFICGGKSVGKSVLLRYLINRTLNHHRKVLLIDLDPGQPEFTVSGCISASIVDAPVFGPNYTHLREPTKCVYVSEINISYDYNSYIEAVKCLISSCTDLEDMPTIVNFMGYVRGLGFQILAAVVAIVKPSSVVEIRSKSNASNYKEDLQHSSIITAANKLAPEIDTIPFFSHLKIDSVADDKSGWHLEPRQIREMSVLTYFGEMLRNCNNSLSHKEVPVFRIDLSRIILIHKNKIVEAAVVNANLVALCSRATNGNYFCHGWGIVRAVDPERNICYLITPLLQKKLESVDYFILGPVNLPPSIYLKAEGCFDFIPFVSSNIHDSFGAIPKRSYLQRRNIKA